MSAEIGERIRMARKALGLTQTAFGRQIGLKQNSVARIEAGRPTSHQTIAAIVNTYQVSEQWLMTGEGEMLLMGDPIDMLGQQYNLTPGIVAMIKRLVQMPRSTQELLIRELDGIVEAAKLATEKAVERETETETGMTAEDIHAELDRQLEEQEGTGGESSASSAIA